jgi:hypothetical protein
VHKKTLYCFSLAILLITLVPSVTATAFYPQDYTQTDSNVNSNEIRFLRPSEIIKLYPMSENEIKTIVHVAPQCPVIVDGVLYDGKDISLFDGQRLHFTSDKKGNLYAFTDAVKMETFLEKEYGNIYNLQIIYSSRSVSTLHTDWFLSGLERSCSPGQQIEDLAADDFDNCISSAKIGAEAPVTMWDYAGFSGDSFTMPPGSTYNVLALQGWNDRASSIS